jgi:hypothetical protein
MLFIPILFPYMSSAPRNRWEAIHDIIVGLAMAAALSTTVFLAVVGDAYYHHESPWVWDQGRPPQEQEWLVGHVFGGSK